MRTVLLDTQAWVWALYDSARLSSAARSAIVEADVNLVSPISVYEIAQKVRIGKWPEMAPFLEDLIPALQGPNTQTAPVDAAVMLRAGTLDWAHRDPFDRLLAATALHRGVPIISIDPAFDGVVPRVW